LAKGVGGLTGGRAHLGFAAFFIENKISVNEKPAKS
jgi:hypothetical protein